ncbi:MAG: DedA family protein [Sulfurifustaceae bacterium]
MLGYLYDLLLRLGNWAYFLVFVAAALESAALLGLLVPGESIVLAAGFLAAHRWFEVDVLIVAVFAGAVLGDNTGYALGHHFGRPWLLQHGHRLGVRPAQLERVDTFFEQHGGKAVLFGRMVGFARALVPFVAGSSRLPYGRFVVYNALGAAIWSTITVLLGYFLGESWHIAERWMGRASAIIGAALLAAILFGWLWRRRRS